MKKAMKVSGKQCPQRETKLCLCCIGVVLAFVAGSVDAKIRVSYEKRGPNCRVVIVNSTHHRDQVVFDGKVHGRRVWVVHGGNGNAVCYSISRNPNFCDSGLTDWRCKRDLHWNKTQLFKIR